jgi:AMOP domain
MKKILYLLFSVVISIFIFQRCCNGSKVTNLSDDNWLSSLPPCPCENPDWNGVKLNDGWARDKGDIGKYHKGSSACFRSYPAIETSEGQSGQQCCYDENGKLITSGSGAGTPDKVSTCDGEDNSGIMSTRWAGVAGHLKKDVRPWEDFGGENNGWVQYNKIWKPNNSGMCTENEIIK